MPAQHTKSGSERMSVSSHGSSSGGDRQKFDYLRQLLVNVGTIAGYTMFTKFYERNGKGKLSL